MPPKRVSRKSTGNPPQRPVRSQPLSSYSSDDLSSSEASDVSSSISSDEESEVEVVQIFAPRPPASRPRTKTPLNKTVATKIPPLVEDDNDEIPKNGHNGTKTTPSTASIPRNTPKSTGKHPRPEKEVKPSKKTKLPIVDMNPPEIGIDFGARKFVCTIEGREYFNPSVLIDHCGYFKPDGTLFLEQVSSLVDHNEIKEDEVIKHLKHKLPFLLDRKALRLLQRQDDESMNTSIDATDEQIEEVFCAILDSLVRSELKNIGFKIENISTFQQFLISVPNSYTMIQKVQAEKYWKNALEKIFAHYDWQSEGKVHLYTEGSSALCGRLSKLSASPDFQHEHVVVIDQGDSTTNINICQLKTMKDGKPVYEVTEFGLRQGGSEYTNILIALAKEATPSGKQPTNQIIEWHCNLNSEAMKTKLFQNKSVTIKDGDWKIQIDPDEFHRRCKLIDMKFVRWIGDCVKGTFKHVICVGGGMRNPGLLEKLEIGFQRDSIFYDHEYATQIVCKGLFERHKAQQNLLSYGIEERTPYSYYILVVGDKDCALHCILPKDSKTYQMKVELGVSGEWIYFPLYQVDSVEEKIELTIHGVKVGDKSIDGETVLVQPIGEKVKFDGQLSFDHKQKNFTPTITTTFENGKLVFSLKYRGNTGSGTYSATSVNKLSAADLKPRTLKTEFANLMLKPL
jgi:hypothetical protein